MIQLLKCTWFELINTLQDTDWVNTLAIFPNINIVSSYPTIKIVKSTNYENFPFERLNFSWFDKSTLVDHSKTTLLFCL